MSSIIVIIVHVLRYYSKFLADTFDPITFFHPEAIPFYVAWLLLHGWHTQQTACVLISLLIYVIG